MTYQPVPPTRTRNGRVPMPPVFVRPSAHQPGTNRHMQLIIAAVLAGATDLMPAGSTAGRESTP